MRRILVLRGGALGDFIVTLPALAALRERWPDAWIELVGNATAAALAHHRGLLDAVHSQHEARWSAVYAEAPLPAELVAWLADFDLVLNYWPDPDGAIGRHFPLHPGQHFLAANAIPETAPAAAHYCEPLRALGITPPQLWFRLAPVEVGKAAILRAETAQADPVVDMPIAVHAGSGSSRKNWPIERWIELCRWLTDDRGHRLLLLAGEADRLDPLADFGDLAVNLPLETLVARLHGCRFFIGHDSGVSHLAAACRVPSLLLFGPTDPAIWAPPAPYVKTLRATDSLAALRVDTVRHALEPLLPPIQS